MKDITTGKTLKDKLLTGATKLNEIVSLTLGPRGRNVLLDRGGNHLITNDGYAIAREVSLECPVENLGARVMFESCKQTNARAGDGTTSSIVLATEILRRGLQSETSPVLLKDELVALIPAVNKVVSSLSIPLTSDRVRAIATNSSACAQLGEHIASAFERVGLDGVVTLTENTLGHTTLTHVDGAEFPVSLVTPHMIESPSTLGTTYDNARLLVHDGPIKSLNDILPVLESAHAEKIPLAIIADDFSNEVIAAVLANRAKANLRVILLKLDEIPTRRTVTLHDLVALTNSELGGLGKVDRLVADMSVTRLMVGTTCNRPLKDRIEMIKSQLATCTDEFERSILQRRLARLTSGIAILGIGAPTEVELRERKLRAEDALAAVRAGAREGIVAGGGITYLHIAKSLNHPILSPALESISRKIYENAGQDADYICRVIMEKPYKNPTKNPCKKNKKIFHGFDAKNLRFCNMLESNIIDPAAVIREVITNALSAAATLLTTEAAIIPK